MKYLSETAAADESLATAVLSSLQCAAPQRSQKIKLKSRASPETERKNFFFQLNRSFVIIH